MDTANFTQTPTLVNQKTECNSSFITPKKALLNALISAEIKQIQRSPANRGDLQSINIGQSAEPLHILKDRYLLESAGILTTSNLKCTDIYTEENYGCKIINENFEKVALAYFNLKTSNPDDEYNHQLIRPIHDAVEVAKDRTYLVIPSDHFGDLHSYVKVKRRLNEIETRLLFRQICKTVNLCHKNGVVMRDLKLKKFFFNNFERTNLQYESLEGSFIMNNENDDTLSEKIGCPLYVAPELITPCPTYGGKAADMWALGVILYTMLIGRYPFSDPNGQNLFNKIINGELILPNYLSPKAKCLIRSLLQRNPTERLEIEDIFYHPWMNCNDNKPIDYNRSTEDQLVPDINVDEDIFSDLG